MSTKEDVDYFGVYKFCLLLTGMGLPQSAKSLKEKIGIYCCIIFYVIVTHWWLVAQSYELQDTYSNTDVFIDHIAVLCSFILGSFKFFYYHYNKSTIWKIMEFLEAPEMKFKSASGFNSAVIIEKSKRVAIRMSLILFFLYYFTITAGYLSGMLSYISIEAKDFAAVGGNVTCAQILPYHNRFPFESNTKLKCALATLVQFLGICISVFPITATDVFVLALNCRIAAQYQLLREAFLAIKRSSLIHLQLPVDDVILHGDHSQQVEDEMNRLMVKYTKIMSITLSLTKQLESVITYLNLAAIFTLSVIIVTALYSVFAVSVSSSMIGNKIAYLFGMVYQLWIYTNYGNEITLASGYIPQALYFSHWTSTGLKFRKTLFLNMLRLQQPIYLTIGKFSPLTLTTFVSILRASYSYCAILRNKNS